MGLADLALAVNGFAMPLEQRVRAHARAMPHGVAMRTPERAIDWAAVDSAADGLAARFVALGLRAGDRVGWLGRNRIEYPVLLLATRRARLVLVGLNWRMSREELDYVIAHADPRLIVADQEFRALVPHSVETFSTDEVLTTSSHRFDSTTVGVPSPDDPALLIYTSGTTGKPKGVLYSLAGVEQVVAAPNPLGFDHTSVPLIVPPVFHIAGGIWTQYALLHGIPQILMPAATPATILEAIERWRVTHSLFVPTLVQMVVDEQLRNPRDLSSLRMAAYGAAPMPGPLLRAASHAFPNARFTQAYGMTEALGPVCHLPPAAHRFDKPEDDAAPATGFPDPGVGLRIVDPVVGTTLKVGERGEVLIRTPWPRPTYWKLPNDAKSAYDQDGWLHTGDIGFLDDDGCLHVVDRLGDLIITGGENVYPVEVENLLRTLPGVADAAVFGLPDARWGEVVCAAITVRENCTLDHAALVAACRERMAHYKCPVKIFEVDVLPRNAAGKAIRRELKVKFS